MSWLDGQGSRPPHSGVRLQYVVPVSYGELTGYDCGSPSVAVKAGNRELCDQKRALTKHYVVPHSILNQPESSYRLHYRIVCDIKRSLVDNIARESAKFE